MPIYSGFFNANANQDRTYDAHTMMEVLDGPMTDGVYKNYGSHFSLSSAGGLTITIASGKAKYNGTWTIVDGSTTVTLSNFDGSARYDGIFLMVDLNRRMNAFTARKGSTSTPSGSSGVYFYPIGYVHMNSAGTIDQVVNTVGTPNNPYCKARVDVDTSTTEFTNFVKATLRSNAHTIMTEAYKVLYSGAANEGSITLSDNVANYRHIDIFYTMDRSNAALESEGAIFCHKRASTPDRQSITLSGWKPITNVSLGVTEIYMAYCTVSCSGTSMSISKSVRFQGSGRVPPLGLAQNLFTITNVIGHI